MLPAQAVVNAAGITNQATNHTFNAEYHDNGTVTVEGMSVTSAGNLLRIMIQGPHENVTFSKDYHVQVDSAGAFSLTTEVLPVDSVNIYIYADQKAYYLGVRDRSTLAAKPASEPLVDLKDGDPLLKPSVSLDSIPLIKQKWAAYAPVFHMSNGQSPYVQAPVLNSPYQAGALREEVLQDALHMTKFVRYLAGMSEDITLDPALSRSAQHKVVILEKTYNKDNPHYPVKPDDMDDSFYQVGDIREYENLHYGYDPANGVVSFMDDRGQRNQYSTGHRRAILMPNLQTVGFGYTENYMVMRLNPSNQEVAIPDYTAWPSAGNFPIEMAGFEMFTLQLHPNKYAPIDPEQVTIEMVNKRQKKKWTLYDMGLHKSNAGTVYYSTQSVMRKQAPFISFKPEGMDIQSGDEVSIKVNGLRDLNGGEATVEYAVRFFDLEEPSQPSGGTQDSTVSVNDDSTGSSFLAASNWALAELEKADALGLAEPVKSVSMQNAITREQFSEIAVKFYEALTGQDVPAAESNPFSDTANAEVLKAYRLGIVKGMSEDRFAPNQPIAREELAVMLNRALAKGLPDHSYDAGHLSFRDASTISPWATDAVAILHGLQVVQGDTSNRFLPKGSTTVEQAVIMAYRLLSQVQE